LNGIVHVSFTGQKHIYSLFESYERLVSRPVANRKQFILIIACIKL